ncbi:MAG: hypothetical protein TECD_01159 [Hyphomicrobiaceae bacterium hypho_1]
MLLSRYWPSQSPKHVKPQRRSAFIKESLHKSIEAVNKASKAACYSWYIHITTLTYLTIILSNLTHKDLLLNQTINLPIVNVEISLIGFFFFGPSVFLLSLFRLLLQHKMLYKKLVFLNHDMPRETTNSKSLDIRDEIHSYFFTQLIVGRRDGRYASLLSFRLMVIITFIAAPLFLLYFFQIRFLPYHSEAVTWWHRLHLLGGTLFVFVLVNQSFGRDLKLMDCKFWNNFKTFNKIYDVYKLQNKILLFLYPLHSVSYKNTKNNCSLIQSLLRFNNFYFNRYMKILHKYLRSFSISLYKTLRINFLLSYISYSLVLLLTLTASVPEGLIDSYTSLLSAKDFISPNCYKQYGTNHRRVFFLTSLIHEPSNNFNKSCWWPHWITSSRNLLLTDQDIVKDQEVTEGEFIYILRNRDLKYADFSRSDMKWIDFERSELRYSIFIESNLRNSRFRSADLRDANLSNSNLRDANFVLANLENINLRSSNLQGVDFHSVNLKGANLRSSDLKEASLHSANLQGSNLSLAILQEVNFKSANLQGANLFLARLAGANLNSANLQGANLHSANLQGANLHSSKLQGANLHAARLQGATLSLARLQGANLSLASLQGANLRSANLQGANLHLANLKGADLFLARLQGANVNSANLQGANLRSTSLQGADLFLAKLKGADLKRANIWRTRLNQDIKNYESSVKSLKIDWPSFHMKKALRKTIYELKILKQKMQRFKTPGAERVKAAAYRVEQQLQPLLEPNLLQAHMQTSFETISDNCAWHKLRKHGTLPAEMIEVRASILVNVVCRDDTKDMFVAKSIIHQVTENRFRDPNLARLFLRKLSKKSCKAIYEKLISNNLKSLLESTSAEPNKAFSVRSLNIHSRDKDVGDTLCIDNSSSAQEIVIK